VLGPVAGKDKRYDSLYSKELQLEKESEIKSVVDNFNSFSRTGKLTVLHEADHQIFK